MAVAMLGESSRHLQSLRHFSYAGSRNFAALGLGELQVGAEKVIILEKVPLSNLPSPKKRGQIVKAERLWRKFFSDPSQWADVRAQKVKSKQPDWIHMKTKERLWMKSASNPAWVRKKLAAISPGRASPDGIINVENDEVVAGDHVLQESETIKTMEMQTRAPHAERFDDVSTGTSYPMKKPRIRTVVRGDDSIRELCLNGRPKHALHVLDKRGVDPGSYAYVCLLRRCTNIKDLAEGKYVHAHMENSGFVPSTFVLNALLNMYMKCGSITDARQVFDNMRERDMFTWTMMLTGYARLGHLEEAYRVYEQMLEERLPLDGVTFTTILSVCASLRSLEKGKKVHCDMIKAGIHSDRILGNTLIDMYAKCGNIRQGHTMFTEMKDRDVVTWNIIIAGAARNGYFDEAFELFEAMREAGLKPDKVTYVCVLNVCSSLEQGRILHSYIIEAGLELDLWVGTALLNMYSNCRSLEDALQIFEKLPERNLVTWTSVIAAYAQAGIPEKAWIFYEKMLKEGIVADKFAYTTVLHVCATMGDLEKGKQVHDHMVKSGIATDQILDSTLIDMYAKCGRTDIAHQLLEIMDERDVVSYTALIVGHVRQGRFQEALQTFSSMQRDGVLPNTVTFVGVLKACTGLGSLVEGRRIHASIIKAGLAQDSSLKYALADMYAKCSSWTDAQEVGAYA